MDEVSVDRFDRGLRVIGEVGASGVTGVIQQLDDIAPDLARYVVEFGFGDVYSRAGLEPRDRQLITIASLATLGGSEIQLEAHIGLALDVGVTPHEIVEALIHLCVYAGFPRAINGMLAAKRVFDSRDMLPFPAA